MISPIGIYQAVLLALIALAIYLVPLAVAYSRRHPHLVPIAVLNLALGWTGLGWIAALVWGLSGGLPPLLDQSDSGDTRRERISGFKKEFSWQSASRPVARRDPA